MLVSVCVLPSIYKYAANDRKCPNQMKLENIRKEKRQRGKNMRKNNRDRYRLRNKITNEAESLYNGNLKRMSVFLYGRI